MSIKIVRKPVGRTEEELDALDAKRAVKEASKKKTPKEAVKKATKKKSVKKAVKKKAPTKRSKKYPTEASIRGKRSQQRGGAFEREVVKFFAPLNAIRVGGKGDNALRKSFDVYMSVMGSEGVNPVHPAVVVECKSRQALSISEAKKVFAKLKKRFPDNTKVRLVCIKVFSKNGFFVFFENTTADNTLTMVHSSCIVFDNEASVFNFVS
jgi:hypothetical protein